MTKAINLVLSGGGVKGIALVGAIAALDEAGYEVRRIAGTSAGALVGGLLAAGYTSAELADMMRTIRYEKFRDEGLVDRLGPLGKVISLLREKGIYEGNYFCKWYDQLLAAKRMQTFGDLGADSTCRFLAYAADITNGKLLCFPHDLKTFGIEPTTYKISQAVRASISLPFFYEPIRLGGNYLVDGGILSNFPINAFDDDPLPTIGIKLSAEPGAVAKPHLIGGPISYGVAVFGTMLSIQDQIHLDDPAVIAKTIFVDTEDVLATDFNLGTDTQTMLFEAGYNAARKYLARQSLVPDTPKAVS
jgi:NTE family protein